MERREFIAKSALALIASGIGAGASSSLLSQSPSTAASSGGE
ncbi:hypothetical protein VRB69_04345 [Erwinia aphidicola]